MDDLVITEETTSVEQLRRIFKDQGYLYLKSFFKPETIMNLRRIAFDVLENEGWGKREQDQMVPIGEVNPVRSAKFYQCIAALLKHEEFYLISMNKKLKQFIGNLLGKPVYTHQRKMVRIAYPYHMSPKDLIPAHQDLLYVKGELDTFISWIPLGDCPKRLGGLHVAHRSHKEGVYDIEVDKKAKYMSGCDATNLENKNLDWRSAHYEPGDLLLMHTLTLHASGKNETPYFRLSLDCRFSDLHGHINLHQLPPPYFPNVPSWEELSENWKSINPFEVPKTLKIDQADLPIEDTLNRGSLFNETL